MIKLTIGQVISSAISLFMLYMVMEEASFADAESPFGKIIDMLSAAIVWCVMIKFMAQDFNVVLYEELISKLVK